MENEKLAVIDISDLSFDDVSRVDELVAELSRICETSGFFYLKIEDKFGRHCVDMLDAARQVFQLPEEEKAPLVNDETSRFIVRGQPIAGTGAGLRPIGQDPNFAADFREIFNISIPIREDEDKFDQFDPSYSGNGRNKWPNPSLLKPNWREVVETYASKCLNACRVLARLFALALGLDKNHFDQPGYFDNPTCLLGMNYYHFDESKWKEGDPFGIKPHMDSGLFTFLLTDGNPGLERCVNRKIFHEETETTYNERIWVPVHCPVPRPEEDGLLIVNLGKNMDYFAGGRFRATLHRVVNKSGSGRYSIPFFYEPNMEAVLEPLISDSDPRKQEMVDYMKKEFGKERITPADLFFERLQKVNNKTFDP